MYSCMHFIFCTNILNPAFVSVGFVIMYKFFSILQEEGGEAVTVMFNTKMKGQDQIGEKGSQDVTDEAPLLIKV